MPEKLRRNVVLVGMMGAGKSAVGAALARMLSVPHLDSDTEIEKAAQESVAEIFARYGEPFFRDREKLVVARLLSGGPAVVSLGGGAFLAPETREVAARHAVSVWLDVDIDVLWHRVRQRMTRPLLATEDPRATLERLASERRPVYALADIAVKTRPEASVAETTDAVVAALREIPDTICTGRRAGAGDGG